MISQLSGLRSGATDGKEKGVLGQEKPPKKVEEVDAETEDGSQGTRSKGGTAVSQLGR